MDEHPGGALHYGQVGRAVYLPEAKAWTFSRSFTRTSSFYYTGVTKTAVPSSHSLESKLSLHQARPADQRLIPHAHPDLAAHWSLVRDDAFSKLLTAIESIYDPQTSSLLDVGFAADLFHEDPKLRGTVPIAAVVTGTCSNAISFRTLVDQDTQYEASLIRLPSIGDTEKTEWSTQGAPIRQIHFAQSAEMEEKAAWMAARLSEATVIFHPLYHRDPMPMHVHRDTPATLPTLQNSRLDANPVVEIHNLQTGGYAHADVAFNPWYHRQLALVDTRGCWSVWEISGRQRRQKANWTVTRGLTGRLPWESDSSDANRPRHDGWASILWVADFSTLLVSDRRCVMLYQITGTDGQSTAVELGMGKQSEWVLDVQRSSQNASHFFLLTTSRLLWFDATLSPVDNDGPRPPMRPRFCWRHFRDPEDTTLRISELVVTGFLNLVLYSRLTELVQVFPCPSDVEEQTESNIASDPFLLDMPSTAEVSATETGSRVQFSDLVFREIGHSQGPLIDTPYNPDMTLIKLFWTDSSLATHETLFRARDKTADEKAFEIERSNILKVKRRVVHHLKKELVEDDFVVDDWDESVAPPHAKPRHIAPEPTALDLQWTLNWASIYSLAVAKLTDDMRQNSLENPGCAFDQAIDKLRDSTNEQQLTEGRISETSLELSGGRPVLGDIDDNADDLARLVATVLPENPDSTYRFITLPSHFSNIFYGMPTSSSDNQSSLDLLKTYDGMITEWLAGLPHGIPNSTRRMKERVIRGVALDLILARLVRVSNGPNGHGASRAPDSVDTDHVMEDYSLSDQGLTRQISSSQTPMAFRIPSSQTLATKGTAAQSRRSATPRAPPEQVSTPVYSSLSAFTTFNKPRRMPRNVTNLLSHWQLAVDPATYEWQKISHIEEEEAAWMSGPSTPKRGRKKRSQYSVGPQGSTLPPTPVAPMIRTWGSQPERAMPLTSSQPTLDEAPMTQTERGQFGMREVKKSHKAKKKRAAGF
ncbi:hypothetical protein N7492_010106 [Penicillium capsulatum]|uniref:RNA polymerase I-specific transcription initiation factor RRN6-like protein n=1 Tax=Penicillium capsulatum TaxID=69766 RepID=A0A9W9HLS9_9EURO|nr:hypothetical protein N7492_010106 [Penicillium capsulatum]KAJ6112615.1 hypothetical protein N7512_007939 [Penicillium capsulatum]